MDAPASQLFKVDEIYQLNNGLAAVVRDVCKGARVVLVQRDGLDRNALEKLTPGVGVIYTMAGRDAKGRYYRERGGEIRLVMLRQHDGLHDVWASCFVQWTKHPKKFVSLHTLSWTFTTGRENDHKLRLRAEWHATAEHPQPHWHFADDMLIQVPQPLPAEPEHLASAPLEVSAENISVVHLPMSGWQHATEYPLCWSHPGPSKPETLVEWSRRVLEVVADQLSYLLTQTGL